MTPEPALTPAKAVTCGHLVVTVPELVVVGAGIVLGYLWLGWPLGVGLGAVAGGAIAWLWWSATVPRWREWARRGGADEDRTQYLAQWTGLVWPKGFFLEKTEFRLRKR